MAIRLTTAPTAEPVTLVQIKDYLNIDHNDDDAQLEDVLLPAARQWAEDVATWRAFIHQTWTLTLDEFPTEFILPRPPLSSVTSVAYNDTDGNAQTLTVDTDYTVDIKSEPGRIVPAYNKSWPSTYGHINDVTVVYIAGYGAAATAVPNGIKVGIMQLIAWWHLQREPVIIGSPANRVPDHVHALFTEFSMKGVV